MPEFFSMTAVLAIFYTVFLGQIFILSVYYPRQICSRIKYVVEHFPPSEYPKLYPGVKDKAVAENVKPWLRNYMVFCYGVAALGLYVLVQMVVKEYRPSPKGGDEIFVMVYFFLQMAPVLYAEVKEYSYSKLLRENYKASKRSADLTPRRLFDFVPPLYLLVAVAAYIGWMVLYLSTREFGVQPDAEIYGTLFGMTAMQVMFASIVYKNIYGKKHNPYMADEDRKMQAEVISRVMVVASIGGSLFLTLTQMADDYQFEVFDPVFTSAYMQFCAIFGMGLAFRTMKVEKMDFEGYRADSSEA